MYQLLQLVQDNEHFIYDFIEKCSSGQDQHMKYRTSWDKDCFLRHMINFKQHFIISPILVCLPSSVYEWAKLLQTFSRSTWLSAIEIKSNTAVFLLRIFVIFWSDVDMIMISILSSIWMSLIILCLQALGVYWFFSNILAIGVSAVIKHPSMRDRLKIPQPIQHTVKNEKPSGDTIWQRTKHGTLSVYPITCPFLI